MSGINGVNGCGCSSCQGVEFAPTNRDRHLDPLTLALRKLAKERAEIEKKEIEQIKNKAPEERTLDDKTKLAAYNIEKALEFAQNLPDPRIYVA